MLFEQAFLLTTCGTT